MTNPVAREDAVKAIADHLADRDRWVITVPPDAITQIAVGLGTITGWTAYLDSGLPLVLRTDQAEVLSVTGMLIHSTVVVTVPKTTPAATLSTILVQDVPDDGSQDIVIVHTGGPIEWPLLFVDAVAIVDPRAAAQLRAAHIPNLN